MNTRYQALEAGLAARFGDVIEPANTSCGQLTYVVAKDDLLNVCLALRDEPEFGFEMLMDVCGVDYLTYGESEWKTRASTDSGFSRGVEREVIVPAADTKFDPQRFAVVYQLLSVSNNLRLRLRVFSGPENPPVVPSLVSVWSSADWFEREAFDLYGILFEGHPDLRRILTDYGFIGHPFRKDFPVSGNVEMHYDASQGRVVYRPVEIEPRTLVPRVIRDDNRYTPEIAPEIAPEIKGSGDDG